MRPSVDLPAVYLCRDIVDFRKGINGLAVLVEEVLCRDPFSEQLYVFCNRRRDRVKILYWERSGFCLWQKRLEKARFKWPRQSENDVITLNGQQLNWLLDGYDVMKMHIHAEITTDDGHRISLHADGVALPEQGNPIAGLREKVTLFTSSKVYSWVNTLQVWGTGTVDLAEQVVRIKGYAA